MNTRSRFTLSTVLGIALAGVCLGSAQAQSGMTWRDGRVMMDENDMTMSEEMIMDPAPIGYPFAAPGGLHLYHFTDYTGDKLVEQSATMAKMDHAHMQDGMMRDRDMMRKDHMMSGGYYMTDENGMMMDEETMMEPAPIGYPFAGPGALHLYHFTDYTMEGIAEQSASMQKMDDMHKQDGMMRDRMMWRDGRVMMDENDMSMDDEMVEPAPIGYPFAAPGGLHLYHFTDYTGDKMVEQSVTMQKMDDAHMADKKRMDRMNKSKMPK
jgi:hypothetical protein